MLNNPYDYSIFHDFIESYLPDAFQNINPEDPIMLKLENVLEENDQYFQVFDMGQMKFLYTSNGIRHIFGIAPEDINPGHYEQLIHPDDEERLCQVRSHVFKIEKELLMAQNGSVLTSYNLKVRDLSGKYMMFLTQGYLFYTPIPRKTVYLIQVITKIDWFKFKKNSSHYYSGDNVSLFKFPSEELLNIGHNLTTREFEIISLIAQGLSSKDIAEKLFISLHTVNTHRSNILSKSKRDHISDYIYDIMNEGLL